MGREEANRIAQEAQRERRGRRLRAPLKLLLPTAAALGAGAAVAIGQIPGSDGVIQACYSTNESFGAAPSYGTLRVIDPGQRGLKVPTSVWECQQGEQAISWNQQGLAGPPGPQGPAGANGATGAPGAGGTLTLLGNTNFSITAGGHSELFLKLEQVKGAATTSGFKNDIALTQFAFGSESPVTGTQASGAASGRVTISTFELTKRVDRSDVALQRDLANGTVLKVAEIDVVHASAKGVTEVASYKLSDVLLKSISISGADDRETVLGSFRSLQETLGSGSDKVSTGWNKVANTGSWDLVTNKAS